MKDKHIMFDQKEFKLVEEYAKNNNYTFTKAVHELIKIGISEKDQSVLKIQTRFIRRDIKYLIKLVEQIYSDLEVENPTNPKLSKALNYFKDNYRIDKMND